MLNSLLTRYQDSLKVLAAPSHPDVRERITPLLISKVLRTLRDHVRLRRGRHRAGVRRADAHGAGRDRRVHHRRHARRARP